jgi:hypothetical protein
MVKNIEIKETITDRTSEFSVKKFRIGTLEIDRPTKVIDAKKITKELFKEEKNLFQTILLENSKLVDLKSINRIVSETEDKQIKRLFGFEKWFSEYPHLISPTFVFNPYKEFESLEKISGYFEYYYIFSDPILLVPNIKIEKYDLKTNKKNIVITIDKYLKFVNEACHILDYKNKKPIFVPVSLKLGINDIKRLAKEYIKSEYFNIWFDFEGSAITKPKIARIRAFLKEFDKNGRINDIIVYSTNIKREIISNIKSEKSPSSDILASLIGSNLIGVNREPPRPTIPPLSREERVELKKHKARIFDPSIYYYLKVEASNYDIKKRNQLMNERYNSLFNSKLLDDEFISQTEYFLKESSIKRYITKKSMIKDYKKGRLIKDLFQKEAKITDWF